MIIIKNTIDSINSRRDEICVYIQEKKSISVNKLLEHFDVSIATLRRDLNYLETKKLIKRSYGNVAYNPNVIAEHSYNLRQQTKRIIAEYAASFIEENDTIFINTSTTALLVLQYVKNKNITIITNNANAVNQEHDPYIQLILTGGELRKPKYSITGDFAVKTINSIQADKCFIGCSGISSTHGITTAVHSEVSINEAMISKCKGPVFLLTDHTKIGKISNFFTAPCSQIDYIITDSDANAEELNNFKENGTTVITLDINR